MSVRGALGTMPAEDVLEWAARRRVSGPLTFARGDLVRSLVIEDGAILWASSNRHDEQLGVILVSSGLVAERALADALETRAETGVALGKVLMMSGLVAERDLTRILATKIQETVTDVVAWTDGSFELVPGAQPATTGVNAQLAVDACVTIARHRRARLAQITNMLGADDVTFCVPASASPPPPGAQPLLDTGRLWALAGDRLSAAQIAATCSGERFAVLDALAQLVETGRLVVDRHRRERTNAAIELAAGARGRLRQGDRAGALAMATQALYQDPSDREVRATFATIERARVAEVARRLLARHRVPRRTRDVTPATAAALGLSAAELELAGRVDGCWDLLSLVRSATCRDAEALLAFAHLAELGVVELG